MKETKVHEDLQDACRPEGRTMVKGKDGRLVRTKDELGRADDLIFWVSRRLGVSEAAARWLVMEAMRRSLADGGAQARAMWGQLPYAGEEPTPEEILLWILDVVLARRFRVYSGWGNEFGIGTELR